MKSYRNKNQSANRLCSQPGFTLIEVLVTMIILTVGLLGTAGLTTGVIRGNGFSKNITSATSIAQTQLEAVQRAGYAKVTTTNFPATSATVSMQGKTFSRTTSIALDTPAANMKQVTVAVTWNEANNVARVVTLQTIIAED